MFSLKAGFPTRCGHASVKSGLAIRSSWTTEDVYEKCLHPCLVALRRWSYQQNLLHYARPATALLTTFSSRSLVSLSNDSIRPLKTFACFPANHDEPTYEPLVPGLQLFLSQNFLTKVPGEIFNLDTLRVLSLRGNNLKELPPAIGKLRALEELNVGNNRLAYLPYELLDLIRAPSRLAILSLHPNPYVEADEEDRVDIELRDVEQGPSDGGSPGETYEVLTPPRGRLLPQEGQLPPSPQTPAVRSSTLEAAYLYRTPTRFFQANGTPLRTPPNAGAITSPHVLPQPNGTYHSHAPSLVEIALRACSRSAELPFLIDKLPTNCPPVFPALLEEALEVRESGGRTCSFCGTSFVVKRTETMEFWRFESIKGAVSWVSPSRGAGMEYSGVPLVKRGCSWLCTVGSDAKTSI